MNQHRTLRRVVTLLLTLAMLLSVLPMGALRVFAADTSEVSGLELRVNPESVTMGFSETVSLTATVVDTAGNDVSSNYMVWWELSQDSTVIACSSDMGWEVQITSNSAEGDAAVTATLKDLAGNAVEGVAPVTVPVTVADSAAEPTENSSEPTEDPSEPTEDPSEPTEATEAPAPVISLDAEAVTLDVGQSVTIAATTENADGTSIRWISSNEAVATVDNGTIAALSKGEAIVTASIVSGEEVLASDTVTVIVNAVGTVGFDVAAMTAAVQLDVKENNTIQIPLVFRYSNLDDTSAITVQCQISGLENAGTDVKGVIENGVLTIEASAECEAELTVTILSASVADSDRVVTIDEECNVYSVGVVAMDNSGDVAGVLTLSGESLSMPCETMAQPVAAVSVTHGTYAVALEKCAFTYASSNENVVRCESGKLVAGSEVGEAEITVTASYTYGGVAKEATATFSVRTVRYEFPYSLSLGKAISGIYEGTTFTLVPHVELDSELNTLTSYKIQWTVSNAGCISIVNGAEEVVYGGNITYGGPLQADANSIQYIGNGTVVLQALAAGSVTLTAKLVEVDGVPVSGVSASVSVTVGKDHRELNASDIYTAYMDSDSKTLDATAVVDTLYDYNKLEEKLRTGEYELRIKDIHTFQRDDNGLDARVVAVVGDNHIDFSNVTVNVYDTATGALVLDQGTLIPVEIPAGMLTFYDVETANVGWVQVRVTFKDYYLEDYDTAAVGDDLYEYAEYPTNGSSDGYIWMYVRKGIEEVRVGTGQLLFEDKTYYPQYVGQTMEAGEYILVGNFSGEYKPMTDSYNLAPGSALTISDGCVTSNVSGLVWGFEQVGDYFVIRQTGGGRQYLYTEESGKFKVTADVTAAVKFRITRVGTDGAYKAEAVDASGNVLGYLEAGTFQFGDVYYSWSESVFMVTQNADAVIYLFKKTIPVEEFNVSLTVNNIRPWLGSGITMTAEGAAVDPPLEGGSSLNYNDRKVDWEIRFTYGTDEYVYRSDRDTNDFTITYERTLSGALTTDPNGGDCSATGKTIGAGSAVGYYTVTITDISKSGMNITLESPITISVPVIVREDSVQIDRKITYGLQLDNAWGDSTGYNYISVMGAGPTYDGYYISSYAISYTCDLPEERYVVGIRTGSFGFNMAGKGIWHEEFRVSAPLGTSSVTPYLHSVTRLNGTVLILDEGERTGGADYNIDVAPELMILEAKDNVPDLEDVENYSTVTATITDKDGNVITASAVVKWTMRNTTYATSGDITETGKRDLSFNETVAAGYSKEHTVYGQKVGVTYYTAQLMSVNGKDVSKQNIADYVIIYVIDSTNESDSMDVVVDYGKPLKIDITSFVENAGNYDFLGFSDLEHSLRRQAYTAYGQIEIDENDVVTYTLSDIMQGIDQVYVIFQYVENGTYYWRHHVLNIIPATLVYYETDGNFADVFTYSGNWDNEVRANCDCNGECGVGENGDPQCDEDCLGGCGGACGGECVYSGLDTYQNSYVSGDDYGYDSSYDNDTVLSNGSTLIAYGAGVNTTTVSFTFTGTGFDIISRTGWEQATVRVQVMDANGAVAKKVSVINKGANELYQIPVASVRGLDHGTYTVTIGVYQGYTAPDSLAESVRDQVYRGNEFYFDAIRIYDTAMGDPVAEETYKEDGEYAAEITKVGQLLVDQLGFNALAQDSSATGVLFMDAGSLSDEDFVSTGLVSDYDNYGPNNEIYLSQNQGIAFILSANGTNPASIHIGAKSVTGEKVTLDATIRSTDGKYSSNIQMDIVSGTAMYYDVAAQLASGVTLADVFGSTGQAYVIIRNTAEAVLSITDIKIGYSQMPKAPVEYLFSDRLAEVTEEIFGLENEDSQTVPSIKKADDGNWYYYVDGTMATDYNGLFETTIGTWYIANGQIDFTYNGLCTFENSTYYIRGGCVDDTLDTIAKRDGQWLYFNDGKVNTTYTGMIVYGGGMWYVTKGTIDFNKTGIVEYDGKSIYVRYGQFANTYDGLVKANNVWLYVSDGYVATNYTGLAKNSIGWWYVENGLINTNYTGLGKNLFGQWYVEHGQVNTDYTGLVKHNDAYWYVVDGLVQSGYTGTVEVNGVTYNIENGKLIY